jgi:predicted DsbA family dithiol-disulfide isomerase
MEKAREKVLEVLFDYVCPYCYKIHADLKEIREQYPGLRMRFVPCEAHPRPEQYGMHSDLCVMGMYYCMESGADVWQYHDLIYDAIFVHHINVEDIGALSAYMGELLDEDECKKALTEPAYRDKVTQNNRYAWGQLGLAAVPSLCAGRSVLRAVPGVGITREQIRDFVRSL